MQCIALSFIIKKKLEFCFTVGRRFSNSSELPPLHLEWIDYCFQKNGQKHRTDKYYCMSDRTPTLVVRRGIPICFHLKFDRDYDMSVDNVSFMFKLGGKYEINLYSYVILYIR